MDKKMNKESYGNFSTSIWVSLCESQKATPR
jgi:hypothetical protein